MNKRGLIVETIGIGILLVVGFFWFIGELEEEGIANESCVVDSCCHAKGCVWESEAPNCDGSFCTMSCEPETMDCGAGHCEVVYDECEVVWDE